VKVLGIESTAHTFGLGVLEDNKIIKNIKYTSKLLGNVHPREVSYEHQKIIPKLLDQIERYDFDIVGYSKGPGMGFCLKNGYIVAKTISNYLNIPLIAVDHCVAHIEIGKFLFDMKDPLVLYVAGANTQIIGLHKNIYRIYGETLDIGLGNLLDNFGRELNLEFPCGPKIEELAKKGEKYINLPYTIKGNDLVFSGLLTDVCKKIGKYNSEDLCYSLQETAFSMVAEVFERILAHTKKKEVLLVGGVAANRRLQEMIKTIAYDHEARFEVVPLEYTGDNGVMIAVTAMKMYKSGYIPKNDKPNQYFRIDQEIIKF
jgi:N6-L-threonylcarbamoyladenine synthase